MTGPGVCRAPFAAGRWRLGGAGPAVRAPLPKNQPKTAELAAKKTQPRAATRDENLKSRIVPGFGDNNLNGIVAFGLLPGDWKLRFSLGMSQRLRWPLTSY